MAVVERWPLERGFNKSQRMDCPPKKVAVVERWLSWKGGCWWRFDCTL